MRFAVAVWHSLLHAWWQLWGPSDVDTISSLLRRGCRVQLGRWHVGQTPSGRYLVLEIGEGEYAGYDTERLFEPDRAWEAAAYFLENSLRP